CSDLDNSHQVVTHTIKKSFPDESFDFLLLYSRGWSFLRPTVDCCNRMILGRRVQSALVDVYERSGRKCAHFGICGEGLRHAAKQVEPDPSGGIGLSRNAAARHERLDLRSKAQCRPIIRIVQRLDPIWITRQHQLLLLAIPYTEREHAP